MRRTRFRGSRSGLLTALAGTVVAALIATVAIISGGYVAQKLDLGDGSVWVASNTRHAIARANPAVLALDTVVASSGDETTVVQGGKTVLVVDRTANTADIVDAATAVVTSTVPLPKATSEVYLAGSNVVLVAASTGLVWIHPITRLSDLDAGTAPTLTLGAEAVTAIGPTGTLVAYSAAARRLYSIDATALAAEASSSPLRFGSADDRIGITEVDGHAVLLDATSRVLSVDGRSVDLSSRIAPGSNPVLQQPDGAANRVLVGYRGGLLAVALDDGRVSPLLPPTSSRASNVAGISGAVVAPIVVNGCSYAAWAGGTVWRECAGQRDSPRGEFLPLPGAAPTGDTPAVRGSPALSGSGGDLAFVRNGNSVVLTEGTDGKTWAVQRSGQLIDNWGELLAQESDTTQVTGTDDPTPPALDREEQAPVAVDDAFGARAGRSTLLPVLLNDYDVNGDALVVESAVAVGGSTAEVSIVDGRQKVQLTLPPSITGAVSIRYSISDGRGGTASATATVTVRPSGTNSAPVQVRATRADVARGGTLTTSVLGDWVDPEGDPVYLASATSGAPNTVSSSPNGTVVFHDGGAEDPTRTVSLVVSDGVAQGVGDLSVRVAAPGRVPLVAEPFATVAYAGASTTIAPLAHVRGGTGVIRLASVAQQQGADIVANPDVGTLDFTSGVLGTHLVGYAVTDGDGTAEGIVRVDVVAPPGANSTPTTTPKTVFVHTLGSATVDIAASDSDPAGGVLIVTSLDGPAEGSGVQAEIVDQRAVRVNLTAPLDSGQVAFGYEVSNGLARAAGTITVVEIPRPARLQPPVAVDDTATVRVGDVVDIPVLANDSQADGESLTLSPQLVSTPADGSGALFVSGSILRYLAPDRPGDFSAIYQVAGPDGQVAQAEVRIAVREVVAASNAAPIPRQVVARVLAGGTVRITIPLAAIDPDGDSVSLLGQATAPAQGTVIATGTDWFDYRAGSYSAGTDSFDYAVADTLGARATGTVRIGIAPTGDGQNPVAQPDEVRVRPGKTVSIPVLANDTDPAGGTLTVTAVRANGAGIRAAIVGDIVAVTPPDAAGRYGLVYTIQNERGGTASAFITVVVDPAAPAAYPVASDTVLTLSDIVDRDTVDVPVLKNVFFADGDAASLRLAVLGGYGVSATVVGSAVRVTVTRAHQIIPFSVSNPDDPTVVAYAFVWVPGLDDAAPQLDRTATPISVASGATATINLREYVVAAGGKRIRLTDAATVQATHADGTNLVVDDHTLRFTSEPGFAGSASISFDVTDGSSVSDPSGHRATLVLPITVTPLVNQPPLFQGGTVTFEPGESKTLDLARLTSWNGAVGELSFSLTSAPRGFDYTLSGSFLTVTASQSIATGTSESFGVGVRAGTAVGVPGTLRLAVVASTRPLARPAPDSVIAPRGQTTVVDVLSNDEATNPFPGTPLSVVSIRGLGSSALPPGVSVAASADRSRLTITVSSGALPGDTNLQYEVADATGDPARDAFGSIRISVQDRPDAPSAPARADTAYTEGLLTLRLSPPISNNSPITGYVVSSTSHGDYRRDCDTSLRCTLPDLLPGAGYQFTVVATNALGSSRPSQPSVLMSADYLPAAPSVVRASAVGGADAAVNITWTTVPDPTRGSAVTGYMVRVTGAGTDYTTTVGRGSSSLTTTADGSLRPNRAYTATVWATNLAEVDVDTWRRTSSPAVTTVGPPGALAGGVTVAATGTAGAISVNWGASDPNGSADVGYSVGRFPSTSQIPISCQVGGGQPGVAEGIASAPSSGWVDTTAVDGSSYRYVVYAQNLLFCSATVSAPIESRAAPGRTSATTVIAARDAQLDLQAETLTVETGTADHFQARLNSSAPWTEVSPGQWLTSLADPSVYGLPASVQYRGCRGDDSSLCGPVSSAALLTPVNTRASILSCSVGQIPVAAPPASGGTFTVRYLYSYNVGLLLADLWTPYLEAAIAPLPSLLGIGVTGVRLKAVITFPPGAAFPSGASFTDPGFAAAACS